MKGKLSLALALAGLLGPGCDDARPTAAAPCNVLLISIDSLRADHVQSYGYGRDTSPNLDRLAAEGTLFETVVAESSWTLPTHVTLFTGLPSGVHGVFDDRRQLSPTRPTLAELLQAAGWRTHGIWSGPYLHPIFGFGRGFDTYSGLIGRTGLDGEGFDLESPDDKGRRAIERAHGRSHQSVTSPRIAELAVSCLEESGDEPFFLFLHFFDVHYDYIPPEAYWRRFDPDYRGSLSGEGFFTDPAIRPDMSARDLRHVIARYDGEILFTDEHVGQVLDALDRLGLAEATLVVVTSDHGDEFFEHAGKGHRRTLYDEVLLVPLIVRQPGRVASGQRVSGQVRHVDLAPTILDWVGLPLPEEMTGVSLAPALEGGDWKGGLPALARLGDPASGGSWTALRHEQSKWIRRRLKRTLEERDVLYDLVTDPAEEHPERDPERLKEAARKAENIARFEELLRQAAGAGDLDAIELPEGLEAELRALGYVE